MRVLSSTILSACLCSSIKATVAKEKERGIMSPLYLFTLAKCFKNVLIIA